MLRRIELEIIFPLKMCKIEKKNIEKQKTGRSIERTSIDVVEIYNRWINEEQWRTNIKKKIFN